MAVVNVKKGKYSLFRGSFSKDGVAEFLRFVVSGFVFGNMLLASFNKLVLFYCAGICLTAEDPRRL